MNRFRFSIAVWAAAALPVFAQETDISGKIAIELNTAQTSQNTCTLSFMVTNGLDQQIDSLVYETVLFDADGQVNRLTLFDFGILPPARPRVRQFAVQNTTCEQLGRLLLNGAKTCEGTGMEQDICSDAMIPSSRTKIEVLG